jgi:aspartyl aminopeptidase
MTTLTSMIAKDLNVDRHRIIDFELNICDTQAPSLWGLHKEFVSSPRLDNLGSSIVALDALVDHSKHEAKERDHSEIDMILLFDHEEVGSQSTQGADSNMAAEITQRIFENFGGHREDYYRAIHSSFLISCDMAHAVHPNYSEKHQRSHMPVIHGGMVVKINANQRYATDVISSSALKVLAAKAEVPLQEFIVRNDSLCGSTIGPIIASQAGIKTIDIGAPMLSMHSIRESCGVVDLLYCRHLFNTFFQDGAKVIANLLNE